MNEWHTIIITTISSCLYAIGGTGFKWVRRYILPIFLACMCLLHVVWWKAMLVGGVACVVFHMPYGSGWEWIIRALTFCMFGLISAPIGASAWNIITVVGVFVLFILSNNPKTEKIFVWKFCEIITGFLVGLQVAYVLGG